MFSSKLVTFLLLEIFILTARQSFYKTYLESIKSDVEPNLGPNQNSGKKFRAAIGTLMA